MADPTEAKTSCVCDTGWCVAEHLYEQNGGIILLCAGIAFLFYKMVWKVWKASIKSKDDEIERLTEERNALQRRLFLERLSSNAVGTGSRGEN